jgi:hypothetical protein
MNVLPKFENISSMWKIKDSADNGDSQKTPMEAAFTKYRYFKFMYT